MRFLVGRTYSETTPEACENGDFSDTGWVFEFQEMDFKGLMRELSDCSGISSSVPHVGCWAHTSWDTVCYGTGTDREESIHINQINGRRPTAREIKRIFRAAGLWKGVL